jgi:hypothetical protein
VPVIKSVVLVVVPTAQPVASGVAPPAQAPGGSVKVPVAFNHVFQGFVGAAPTTMFEVPVLTIRMPLIAVATTGVP